MDAIMLKHDLAALLYTLEHFSPPVFVHGEPLIEGMFVR